jgi:hypothetical protein
VRLRCIACLEVPDKRRAMNAHAPMPAHSVGFYNFRHDIYPLKSKSEATRHYWLIVTPQELE